MIESVKQMVNVLSTCSGAADDKLMETIEMTTKKTLDIILDINNKIVDLDERIHILENRNVH